MLVSARIVTQAAVDLNHCPLAFEASQLKVGTPRLPSPPDYTSVVLCQSTGCTRPVDNSGGGMWCSVMRWITQGASPARHYSHLGDVFVRTAGLLRYQSELMVGNFSQEIVRWPKEAPQKRPW